MVCIYCGKDTKVTNSREKVRLPSTWRRRRCNSCIAQFSTIELPNFATSLVVTNKNGALSPFSRDKLFISIYKALGHRDDATQSASGLIPTVISTLLRKYPIQDGSVSAHHIALSAYIVLKRFDPMSAHTYKAYHKTLLDKK
ncbi:MAG: hypothetical protein M3Q14_01185 [bacterium]|nr:hypothetical protein [bacterium]